MNNSPENKKQSYPFYPDHLYIEVITAVICLVVLVALALIFQTPLDEMANPADTTYVPRPEWYFLFIFEMLKYFEGGLVFIGVVVLPLLAFLALFFLPFYDKKPTTAIFKRPLAAACGIVGVILVVGLTIHSMSLDAKNPRIFKKIHFPPVTAEQIAAGEQAFNTFCLLCHAMDGKGGFMAPDLTQIGGRASRTYVENVIINPQLVSQQTIMSLIPLSKEERHAVSAFLAQKK